MVTSDAALRLDPNVHVRFAHSSRGQARDDLDDVGLPAAPLRADLEVEADRLGSKLTRDVEVLKRTG